MSKIRFARGWTTVAVITGVVACCSMAIAADQENMGVKDGVSTYTRMQSMPKAVTLAKLSNGLTVIVQENHVAPVATVRCYVKNTGSAYEGRFLGAGLSHLLEHLVAGGSTANRSEKELEQIVDTFGGATNAYTSSHLTAYFIDCPARHTMTCIELLADTMQHISFEQSEFDREFKVVQRELADGEVNRRRVQWKLLGETLYTKNPARNPTIGYLEVLQQIKKQDAVDFYRERYVPNNQIFVVVGDVNTKDVLDQVARQWTGTLRGRETYVPLPSEPEQMSPREVYHEMDGATCDFVLAWPTVDLASPDLYALDVASYILTEGDSSRLVRKLKYEKQLALSVSSASYTPHFVKGCFAVFANCRPKTWEQAEQEILKGVYRLQNELVSNEELAKAKKQKAAELVFGQQTVQDAAESLGRNYLSTADPLFDHAYVENIQKVTAEQIRRVARRYFVPNRLNRIVITPVGGSPKDVSGTAEAASSAVRMAKLKNGIRVLVKRHANLPLVSVQAYTLGAGLVDTPETAGRASLVGAMLDKGTARHSAQQIADFFDSIGGKITMSAGRSTVFGTMTTMKDDFPNSIALFAECFTKPQLPSEEFEKVKQLALGAIERRANNPQQEAFEVFHDALPISSPYHLMQGGTKESVGQLTVEDIRAYHAKYFVPSNMIVTVFGHVEPDEALELVERHFGHLKPANLAPIEFDRPNAITKSISRHKKINKPTGIVLLGFPGTSILDQKDNAAITLLDAIMSGYNYPGGWLHTELRGQGLVYYVHAFQLTGPAPGYFTILSQTQPNKIKEVVDRIFKNVERAKAGKIEQAEFDRSVEMVVSLHAQANTTIADQARQAALDELYGLGFDYDKSFDKRIRAVTLDDVIRVARKYLNNHVLVTASPEK